MRGSSRVRSKARRYSSQPSLPVAPAQKSHLRKDGFYTMAHRKAAAMSRLPGEVITTWHMVGLISDLGCLLKRLACVIISQARAVTSRADSMPSRTFAPSIARSSDGLGGRGRRSSATTMLPSARNTHAQAGLSRKLSGMKIT